MVVYEVKIVGAGQCCGSQVVSNRDLASELGLPEAWFVERTGITERRVCAVGETVEDLVERAILRALEDAGLAIAEVGPDWHIVYIHNGFGSITPPPAIDLCRRLGLARCRTITINGVCAEVINAIEIAALQLQSGLCRYALVVVGADYAPVIDRADLATAGLFGAGAGALVLARAGRGEESAIHAIRWESDVTQSDLGRIDVREVRPAADGVWLLLGHYRMNGPQIARQSVKLLREMLAGALADASWSLEEVYQVFSHQPNVRMLESGARAVGIGAHQLFMPVRELGNMGPASMLVAFVLYRQAGGLERGAKIVFQSFGLGVSCGVVCLTY